MTKVPPSRLHLSGLWVRLRTGQSIVRDLSLRIGDGDILGLVGESGSGKSTTALALLGYSAPGVEIPAGDLIIAGEAIPLNEAARQARGRLVTYVPQNPGTALNPAQRIGRAILDVLAAHRPDRLDDTIVASTLEAVGLPGDVAGRYPHQLSGGQQQRACIAVSLACEPAVVVLDEPTTGLDVITQDRILTELLRLRKHQKLSMLYVTHDLSVVAQVADRIAVMYAGHIVEDGVTAEVLTKPLHPYTRGLIASIPDHQAPVALESMPGTAPSIDEDLPGCPFAPRCPQATQECRDVFPPHEVFGTRTVCCHHWQVTPPVSRGQAPSVRVDQRGETMLAVTHLHAEHRARRERVVAANDVTFELRRKECIALVGESGSGKTTIARAIAGLHETTGGTITLGGTELSRAPRKRSPAQRRRIQLIFQNPSDALNPRHTVRTAIARPAHLFFNLRGARLEEEVDNLLERVRLPERLSRRYPAELSGGERQRVAIARALAARPDVLLCDEITSALDVSVQAAILKLLMDLRVETDVALLFITHDLGLVRLVADQVIVLEHGAVCEQGTADHVLSTPAHPYTQALLAAAPSFSTLRAAPTGVAP